MKRNKLIKKKVIVLAVVFATAAAIFIVIFNPPLARYTSREDCLSNNSNYIVTKKDIHLIRGEQLNTYKKIDDKARAKAELTGKFDPINELCFNSRVTEYTQYLR